MLFYSFSLCAMHEDHTIVQNLNALYETHRDARKNVEKYFFTWEEFNTLNNNELRLRFLQEAKRLCDKFGEPVFRRFTKEWEKDCFQGLPKAMSSLNNGERKVVYDGCVRAIISANKVTTFLA